ncbi:endo-1,4-beta-xylanase [Pelagicoccus albus]|uniref:Beta-xylanase n=1 Tax=Pelagicoccus albus TaxID=415222 RepID=A0A7X1E6T1_9BACT|nr:endo-1,4-beta-xylanase [Pelagicoccus albus]MBC2604461.1 endo-1,4-beta-xylanase [Pelagicoccus albus]
MDQRTPLLATLALIGLPYSLAQADISHRKADLTVQVQTVSGTPLEGATIQIEMLNHAFRFGCAVEHHRIDPESSGYDPFTVEQLQKHFNSMTYGNVMKWTYYEARSEEENLALAALPKTLAAFDSPDALRLRGHVTVWGSSYQVPTRVRNSSDGDYIQQQILEHVSDYHATFKDSGIDNFDLYNEHFHVPELLIDKIADSSDTTAQAAKVAEWFNQAKASDPEAVLFINDYNILNYWTDQDEDVIAYKAFIDAVRDAGGQIDGIGLQAHMDRPTTTKERVTRRLDILAAPMEPTANHPNGLPGLRLEITELDMSVQNRFFDNSWGWPNPTMEEQVSVTQAVLEAAFEHPSVDGLTIWGLNDFDHWRGNSIMYDDLSDDDSGTTRTQIEPELKATGQLWIDKVEGEWWEDHEGLSSSSGSFAANTFKGSHRVTVTYQGESQEAIVRIDSEDTVTFEFSIDALDATTYDEWSDRIDWLESSSERDADPDADGVDNFSEFAFGTDPLAFDSPQSPQFVTSDGVNYSIRYALRAADSGIIADVMQSSDLVNWEYAPRFERVYFPTIIDGFANYTVHLPLFETDLFYRIATKER